MFKFIPQTKIHHYNEEFEKCDIKNVENVALLSPKISKQLEIVTSTNV